MLVSWEGRPPAVRLIISSPYNKEKNGTARRPSLPENANNAPRGLSRFCRGSLRTPKAYGVRPGKARFPNSLRRMNFSHQTGETMNIVLVVVASLAVPLLWLTAFTDRQSFNEAIKLREMITEILVSVAEWENGKSTVFKILALKSYPQNLVNRLRLIRGYIIIRLVVKLPRKRNVRAASAVLQQFYECVWDSAPGFRPQAELMALEIKRLLT